MSLGSGISGHDSWDSGGLLISGNYPPGYAWDLFDNSTGNFEVNVTSSPVPEPGTFIPISIAFVLLGGLAFARRS